MDGLIGNYGGVSDEEMEYEEETKPEAAPQEHSSDTEVEGKLSGEIEATPDNNTAPGLVPTLPGLVPTLPGLVPTLPGLVSTLPGLVSYSSTSPTRSALNAANKTALISLLSTYDDLDKTLNEDKNEEDIEKQYDVTVENSDSESDSENFMGKLDDEGNVKIPSEPKGKCSSKLQEKIATELQKRRKFGYDFCSRMRDNKEFRNPSIYDKLIDMIGINETGTNFTDPILNKGSWRTESFYKQLAEKQQKDYDRREAERKKEQASDPNSKIKQMVIAEKEKKSKWDEKSSSAAAKDRLDKQLKAQLIQDKINKQIMARTS